jgi:predicted RNase H-like nuclease (RuvC/YqgF family)
VSAISGFCEKCNKFRKRHCDGNRNTCMSILFDTIEALQKENNGWQERYYELDAGHSRLFKDFCKLQKENEQLKADCDRMLGEVQELTMECNRFKERLQISPYGDDKIDELDEALENCKFQYEQLKLENEQLRIQ